MNDCVLLEMRMAEIMSQQEASGFRFDVAAAERVRGELQKRSLNLNNQFNHDISMYLERFIHLNGQTKPRDM